MSVGLRHPSFALATLVLLVFSTSCNQPKNDGRETKNRPKTVKVAAIQCSSELGAIEANRQKLTALVRQAAAGGAKIIVLPETAITGYLSQDLRTNWHRPNWPLDKEFQGRDPASAAETVPGPSTDYFCTLAQELKVYLTIPLLERSSPEAASPPEPDAETAVAQEQFFNTVCLANPEGQLVAHYRKLAPWPHPEKSWATPGDRGIQTYDTEYGRVGLAICFDIHTILEQYRDKNIWALLYPIAWVDEDHPADWFWHQLPNRVAPFRHCVIGANWSVDQPQKWRGYGFSTILGPDGRVLATAKSLYGSEIIYSDIACAP